MYIHIVATNGLIIVPPCTLYNVSLAINIHLFSQYIGIELCQNALIYLDYFISCI